MKKQKKFGRTLKLNKETITRLNQSHTGKLFGGASTDQTCPTYAHSCMETRCPFTECKAYCDCQYPLTY